MPAKTTKSTVKGGWIGRSAKTGRFVAVGSKTGVRKASSKTSEVIEKISDKRRAALARLADR